MRGPWIDKVHGEIGCELLLADDRALQVVHFVANCDEFLAAIRYVTQCVSIVGFSSRGYRLIASPDYFDSCTTMSLTDV